ncbi:hypothetical protein [Frankia sp. AgB32]|uniref:hypothetical protein n=1 Tax=Frankia sp. AgB32 TaxID=631119 RepID=UPI00200ECFA3|nr:hypothetical protein [Frankia sp. AgB32]MCK9898129.1 hypothetical protein [Frankia sp. AgB32]
MTSVAILPAVRTSQQTLLARIAAGGMTVHQDGSYGLAGQADVDRYRGQLDGMAAAGLIVAGAADTSGARPVSVTDAGADLLGLH